MKEFIIYLEYKNHFYKVLENELYDKINIVLDNILNYEFYNDLYDEIQNELRNELDLYI